MSAIAWTPIDWTPIEESTKPWSRPTLTLIDGGRTASRAAIPAPRLRLTRRGRLVIGLLIAAVIALALAVGGSLGADAAPAPHTVTVLPGQTLSEIAAAELPTLSISEGVVSIQVANRMSTAQVDAGRTLVIPAP